MTSRQYRDTPGEVKIVLCALWGTMLLVCACVDIFGLCLADVLGAAPDGRMAAFTVNQVFLTLLDVIARTAWGWASTARRSTAETGRLRRRGRTRLFFPDAAVHARRS